MKGQPMPTTKQLTEDEWSDRFVPSQDEDGNESVTSDYSDADPSLVWSCIDDDTDADDRIIVSGIHPYAHAYWIMTVPVPPGETYMVRIPNDVEAQYETTPEDQKRISEILEIKDATERGAAWNQLMAEIAARAKSDGK
jgi:hypothetical protein